MLTKVREPYTGSNHPQLMVKPSVIGAFDQMLDRVCNDNETKSMLSNSFKDATGRTQSERSVRREMHYVPYIPGNDKLLADFCSLMVLPDSRFNLGDDLPNVRKVLGNGCNALLVANHCSYVDFIAMHQIVCKADETLLREYTTVSSKVVGSGWTTLWDGKNRLQVYPEYYFNHPSQIKIPDVTEMRQFNVSTLRNMIKKATQGGAVFMVYGNQLGPNVDETMINSNQILRALRDDTGRDCIVYPIHISGTENIAPDSPRFTDMIAGIKPSTIGATVGRGEEITELIGKKGELKPEEIYLTIMKKIKKLSV